MNKNITTKTSETEAVEQETHVDLVDEKQVENYLLQKLEELPNHKNLSTAQVDRILQKVADQLHVDSITTHVAEYTARSILGAVRRKDWWLDKFAGAAIQTAVTGAVIGIGALVVPSIKRGKLFRGITVGNSPFSNTDAAPPSPRSLRTRRESHLQSAESVA